MLFHENIVKDTLSWIEENLESPLSIKIIAERSGYTKWHLQKIFKEQTGIALWEYVRSRRLSCVALALQFTRENIVDIAIRYEYDSQQSLCRAFKKQFNITPSMYRKQSICRLQKISLPSENKE
ncbi:hypothetical protein Xmau_03882 [Xenorhabdus mauleonii]|uniref:AraC family transcriptional regulator, mar-sox-rob regulon activator n=1 Tax=Xenorhabdus mauleonii TaxID=351675 RepID=A0A1I3VKW3_9GAMM|nr:helix-turn-helix domain-containing protein [Xenorhabdus mauleonii]PHM37404.1 hypothetical protein Xmau_03882 [Xenorhabdus mauleonii]SFJ96054.1 AraC family transcriptional regulator, mar-sox-rob regulon activator [Xenorhabdus mauleonii]